MASPRGTRDEVVASFATPEDPRSQINRQHPLPSALVIAALTALAGAAGPAALARWAESKEDLLGGILDRPHGIPGKDVSRRLLRVLRPAAFEAASGAWAWAGSGGGLQPGFFPRGRPSGEPPRAIRPEATVRATAGWRSAGS